MAVSHRAPTQALAALAIALVAPTAAAAEERTLSSNSATAVQLATDGRRVLAVWAEGPPARARVVARLLSASGRPLGRVRRLSPPGHEALATPPAVAWDPRRRRWLVAWPGAGPDQARRPCPTPPSGGPGPPPVPIPNCEEVDREIFLRAMAADGRPRGSVSQVTRTGAADDPRATAAIPALAPDRAGRVLLSYVAVTDERLELRARRVDRRDRARRIGPPTRRGDGLGGAVTALRGGGWLAAFSFHRPVSEGEVFARRPGGRASRLSSGTEEIREGFVAMDGDIASRRVLVVWQASRFFGGPLVGRMVGADGRPAAAPVTLVSQSVPGPADLAARVGGGFLLAHTVVDDKGDHEIHLVRLGHDGRPAGGAVAVTDYRPGGDDNRFASLPAVVAVRGRAVVGWTLHAEGSAKGSVRIRSLAAR